MGNNQSSSRFKITSKPIILAIVVILVVMYIFSFRTVDTGDMSPTVRKGDVILIKNKSYTESKGYPKYDEIVAFGNKAKDKYLTGDGVLRVVGLPGDTIEIKGGNIYRNDEVVKDGYFAKKKVIGEYPSTEVEKGKVFVLYDDLEKAVNSKDDDLEIRLVKGIKGKCQMKLWPLSRIGIIK